MYKAHMYMHAHVYEARVYMLICTRLMCVCSYGTRWPALAIHGDKQQGERDWVLQQFKSGQSTILVATDVAARGEAHVYMLICIRLVWLSVCICSYGSCVYAHMYKARMAVCVYMLIWLMCICSYV